MCIWAIGNSIEPDELIAAFGRQNPDGVMIATPSTIIRELDYVKAIAKAEKLGAKGLAALHLRLATGEKGARFIHGWSLGTICGREWRLVHNGVGYDPYNTGVDTLSFAMHFKKLAAHASDWHKMLIALKATYDQIGDGRYLLFTPEFDHIVICGTSISLARTHRKWVIASSQTVAEVAINPIWHEMFGIELYPRWYHVRGDYCAAFAIVRGWPTLVAEVTPPTGARVTRWHGYGSTTYGSTTYGSNIQKTAAGYLYAPKEADDAGK